MLPQVRTVRARGDVGVTLPEILVAIAILGICVAALLAGTAALPGATPIHRRDAQADAMLRNWAEAIKAKGFTSTGMCAAGDANAYSVVSLQGGSYLPAAFPDERFTAESPVVTTWDGATAPAFQSCVVSGATLARVGLTVRTTDMVHPVSDSLEVVVGSS